MIEKTKYNVVKILRSCVTGNAVWIYMGASVKGCRLAYARACRHEHQRIRQLGRMAARRKANIMRLLNDCMAGVPINKELPKEKRAAAHELVDLADANTLGCRDFYDHIMQRRRACGKARGRKTAGK